MLSCGIFCFVAYCWLCISVVQCNMCCCCLVCCCIFGGHPCIKSLIVKHRLYRAVLICPLLSVHRGRGRGRGRSRELAALYGRGEAGSTAGFRPSQYRGVTQERRTGNWRGQLWLQGKVLSPAKCCQCLHAAAHACQDKGRKPK